MTHPVFVDAEGRQLLARAQAARALIRADIGVDRHLVLSYVVWPSARMRALGEPVPRGRLSARELLDRHRFENQRSARRAA